MIASEIREGPGCCSSAVPNAPCFDIFVTPTYLDAAIRNRWPSKRPSIPTSAKRALALVIKQVIDPEGMFNSGKAPF
ncbi:hypothetical protein HHL25_09365 [Rhizobium sp. S-51]|uniref:Uncharacterized protein n=1 Tax=Rhizobium terricola TaxID=2728849 RepID=A0A7Y0AVL5_9HYPH|nr:hypothetical protein [Rhizobium terricola]NML74328.1 hypothetical protein [Rhizobium terricola]